MMKALTVLITLALYPGFIHAELLFDPLDLELSSGSISGFAGTSLTNKTDYEASLFGTNFTGADIERQALEVSGVYGLGSENGLYATLQYNLNTRIQESLFVEGGDLDGYQLAIGGFKKTSFSVSYPSMVWVELNLSKENYSGADERVDISTSEFSLGVLFRVLQNNSLTVSAGPELLISANGDLELTDFDESGEADKDSSAIERDMIGLKAIASYPLTDELKLYGRLSILNESRIAFSLGKQF